MYKILKKIDSVYSHYIILNGNLVANIGNGIEAHITFFDSNFNIKKRLEKSSYTFLAWKEKIIFTTQKFIISGEKALSSYCYDIKGDNLGQLDYTLNLPGLISRNKLLCSSSYGNLISDSEKYWLEIDLDTLDILNQHTSKLGFLNGFGYYTGCHFYLNDHFISSAKSEGKIGMFDFLNNVIWQHDFTEECRYINYDKIDRDESELLPGRIQYITLFGEDKIIVNCKYSKTFCIELDTGNILWENTLTGNREYIIVGDIGFAYSNGGGINKIDLLTGKSLHQNSRFHRLSEMPKYNDFHISTATDTMVYHDGLLWGLIYSNGYSFVVAINPFDYHYEWIHCVESKEKVMDVMFHDNRMYLHTSGSELYIYQKDRDAHAKSN